MKFSANLGFLWTDRALPEAIRAAHRAGFDAVECHWPYDVPVAAVSQALTDTGMQMLGLNTRRGDVAAGDNGLAALPGREAEARAAVDEALDYGAAIGAANVHVMAGNASGPQADSSFRDTLRYACTRAKAHGMSILIEPLNRYDAPDYYLKTTAQATEIINDIGADNLRLMFDCYHVQLTEGNVTNRLRDLQPLIGHIQFAAVPDRGAPDHGELDYRHVFTTLRGLGYEVPLGAEYRPDGPTESSLGWLEWAKLI